MTSDNFYNKFIANYLPLVNDFCNDLGNDNYDGMPEPFFPVFGNQYPKQPFKIMFTGIETLGWLNLTDFMNSHLPNSQHSLFRIQAKFDALECLKWTNNWGTSFWDFIFIFLARFHNISNWKEIRKGEHPNLIHSFGWANTSSIERYSTTAERNDVKYETWERVKKASLRFDKAKLFVESMEPNLIILTNWNAKDEWFEGLNLNEWIIINDHLWYNQIKSTGTHVFWTYHPRWLSIHVGFEKIIDSMLLTLSFKEPNLSFPGSE